MRPTYAQIDLSAISANIKNIRKKVSPAEVMAVVKANAYGHGVCPVARTALDAGATWLGVALLEEGIELREKGFDVPILVFGGEFESQLSDALSHNLTISIASTHVVKPLALISQKLQKKATVHVKVDTGMGRVGVPWETTHIIVQQLKNIPEIELQGIYTHFATSDERDKEFANEQLRRFEFVIEKLEAAGIYIPIKHAANSGAILDMPNTYFDLVRPGIMIYGYYPSKETSESVEIRPAMTFVTHVSKVKHIETGTSVSYGRKYYAKQPTYIATLPVGYADGYNRLLTNQSHVLIRGKRYPVVGRVCMDLIMVNLGPETDVNVGDEVALFGKQDAANISVDEWCELLNTIPYEICCSVSGRVPRLYMGQGDAE